MAVNEVVMPLMGEGIAEATLVKWLKNVGDSVKQNEGLLEVSTDKVDTEIPSPAQGTLVKVMANAGDVVKVNAVIAWIGDAKDLSSHADTSPAPASKNSPANKADKTLPAAPDAYRTHHEGVRSSPLVRKMARDNSIDLKQVSGSGLLGRITKRDIEGFLSERSVAITPAAPTSNTQLAPVISAVSNLEPSSNSLKTVWQDGVETLEGVVVQREKMSRMRTLIAKHMVESVRVSPHVTTVFEIDLHKVVKIRDKSRGDFEAREGFKLTYTPFFIHAAVEALKQHPILNTSIDGEDVLFKKDINIGCAVALGSGLIVPVIKKAGELSLLGIARRLNDLVTRARSKKLTPDEVQGGTFSITNPGGFGSLTSNPIINQPQVAIMGIGTVVKRPVVIEGDAIAIRPMMLMSITFDHRVIDGEQGALFLKSVKEILENYHAQPF